MKNNELSPLFLQPSFDTQKVPTQLKQVLAQALVQKLHNWCMQLFWITVHCVISYCGEEEEQEKKAKKGPAMESKKRIEDIEKKMLRHLTSPLISGSLRPIPRSTKRRISSRPPSPQLFDIFEEE